eukprot:4621252-Pleurochrysis_carterae.AAC.1
MMMVGHTHEDIDALFRRVAEYWSRKGMVLTPHEFFAYLRASVKSTTVHPLVEYVHDYAAFFEECIYHEVKGINDARVFVLKERADGGARPLASAPCCMHNMCSEGSCCFLSRIVCMLCRDGPEGLPPLAPFATAVNDSSKPRFDVVAARANVNKIMDSLKDRFTAAHRAQWKQFFDDYPH